MNEEEGAEQLEVREIMDNKIICEESCPETRVEDSAVTEKSYEKKSGVNKNDERGFAMLEDFGNFRNSDELLRAYQNLRTEFTRKSQELALLKQKGNKNAEDNEKSLDMNMANEEIVLEYLRSVTSRKELPKVIGITNIDFAPIDSAKSMSSAVISAKNFFSVKMR
ncbi:MAG: hypothetical protein FWE01_01800 [Firmicutes bacterium]|nr:hypothetical protein [Bacillota bacterium]